MWLLLLVVGLVGCRSAKPPTHVSAKLAAPPSAFSPSLLVDVGLETAASSRDPRFVLLCEGPTEARALLWSAEIGVNIGPYGTGSDAGGGELPAFSTKAYDAKEDIKPLPTPLGVAITVNGEAVKPGTVGYLQSFDMRYGLLTTHWFAPVKGGFLEARMSSVIEMGDLQSRWDFQAPKGTRIAISRTTPLPPAWETMRSAFLPRAVKDADADVAWSNTPKTPVEELSLDSGAATWLDRRSAVGTEQDLTGLWLLRSPVPLKRVLTERARDLNVGPEPRIEVDGPLPDQQAIDAFLTNLVSEQQNFAPYHFGSRIARFSPFGLSSNRYNGHVFWDADVWLMPALAFIDPSILQELGDYRLSRVRPVQFAPFPWESSVTGKETAPGDSVKEIHISGSVLWGLEFERALGAKIPDTIVKRVANYYLSRATKRPDGKLGLLDVMSPDESHTGPNDLYTNLVAQWAINGATWKPVLKPTDTMYLPADSTSFLTYDNDRLRGYKQAAAVLSIYPLQYPPAETQAKTMMERFQDKVIPNGPAMSDSIHATIWARLNEPDKAYDLWKKSWGEFVKGPFLLFSEKRSSPTTYFTTGAAGCLQSVIYGFLGFRVGEEPEPGAPWKLQLKNGRWLSIKPHLPSAWKSATFRNFRVLGHAYTLTVKREGSKTVTSVKQGV